MSDQYVEDRKKKLTEVADLGIDPYGARFPDVTSNVELRNHAEAAGLDAGESDESATRRAAGRVVLRRVMGSIAFLTLRDSTCDLQIGLQKKQVEPETWKTLKLLDLGDICGFDGHLGKTKTGEITLWAKSLTYLTKSLRPPPEKFHGLTDIDARYRQRYVDLFSNPEVMQTFKAREA